MTDSNAAELIKRGSARFDKRRQLDSFRQEVALNFAPWLAAWTSPVQWGEDFTSHLVDGTPILLARDFIGQVGAMLRPPGKQWFHHRTAVDKINNNRSTREYLDWRSGKMMRIMTDRVTGFKRATKQADEFFGLFGDAVISADLDPTASSLRINNWHTADVVWAIGADGKPDVLTRREKMSARVILRRFNQPTNKIHHKIKEAAEKDGDVEFELRHEMLPADEYDSYMPRSMRRKDGFVSVWVDVQNGCVIRERPSRTFKYVVPRWVSLTGHAYAISPATTIALPDSRLIQQQAQAILEAAEKQVNPPLIATSDAIRGDIRLESLGITWVDRTYDERAGDPLRPLELGKNFNLGVEALLHTQQQIAKAFYLDVLRMPDTRNSKSTVEVQFLIDEYVRAALPLFEPMQSEYNEALLHEIDMLIDLANGYEDREKPKELQGLDFQYAWDNPLSEMLERQKAQMVAEVATIANTIAALDQAAQQSPSVKQLDNVKMMRESVMGIGASAWLLSEEDAEEEQNEIAQANGMQQAIAAAPNIAGLIDSGVNAATAAATIPNQAEPGFAMPQMPEPV